jgi:hypothetical protein
MVPWQVQPEPCGASVTLARGGCRSDSSPPAISLKMLIISQPAANKSEKPRPMKQTKMTSGKSSMDHSLKQSRKTTAITERVPGRHAPALIYLSVN